MSDNINMKKNGINFRSTKVACAVTLMTWIVGLIMIGLHIYPDFAFNFVIKVAMGFTGVTVMSFIVTCLTLKSDSKA